MLDPIQFQVLVTGQTEDTTGRPDHNVRAIVLEDFLVLLHRDTPVKDGGLDGRQILAESLVLVGNLKGQLAGVANDQNADLRFLHVCLLQRRKGKDGRLSHSRLGLADNVTSQNGLRDGLVLDFGRMLESGVDNGAQQFGFEHKVLETRSVDSNIVALFGFFCLVSGGGLVSAGYLLFFVVIDKFVFVVVSHCGGCGNKMN
mmetsp:Transcript_10809/g.27371  ORF Transcript_10809/g.27371 Transcript_10809/m.27371 type:complete len:201 (+) Transcript_10809:1000-1602(+)